LDYLEKALKIYLLLFYKLWLKNFVSKISMIFRLIRKQKLIWILKLLLHNSEWIICRT